MGGMDKLVCPCCTGLVYETKKLTRITDTDNVRYGGRNGRKTEAGISDRRACCAVA